MDYLYKLRRNISLTVDHALIEKRRSDQYVVAFPRSGSTWLRTILAALIKPENGFEPDVFNALIPSVGIRSLRMIRSLGDPRLMMSHTTFRPGLRRVVYLVRDGRDSVVSYYHHTTTREGQKVPFAQWFDLYCRRQYGARWNDNVEGWLTRGPQHFGDNLLIVKFEELKQTPSPYIEKIAAFLGIRADGQRIGRALEMASLENAREREKREARKLDDPNASFYRGGKTGQWHEYLNGAAYERFMDLSNRALKLAGYPE